MLVWGMLTVNHSYSSCSGGWRFSGPGRWSWLLHGPVGLLSFTQRLYQKQVYLATQKRHLHVLKVMDHIYISTICVDIPQRIGNDWSQPHGRTPQPSQTTKVAFQHNATPTPSSQPSGQIARGKGGAKC